ncbi:5-oxoprolinase subunit B family protein [Renibacterium salmoninarum]|nr:allophanate hydrolase subunit 1 [Renibacterium salmoninarum]
MSGSTEMLLLPCGDSAVLAELPDLQAVLALYRALSSFPQGVLDVVPAARTILITFYPERVAQAEIVRWIESADPVAQVAKDGPEIIIDVHYDGPDLAEVAQYLSLSVAEVIQLHSSSSWTAAFTGFAPGFSYLVTDHERLRVPRRNTPRTSIPAGSVALAGEFSAIYPTSSPAGWQLIGRTSAQLWDAGNSSNPALITPGATVRFRAL